MTYTFLYFDKVATSEAKFWYKQKREGLEIEFAFVVRQAFESIASIAMLIPSSVKSLRIAQTNVFPYNIHFYLIEANELIVITAMVHTKRSSNVPSLKQSLTIYD